MGVAARVIGASEMWSHGFTGEGVDVAVIDSGVAPVSGLGAPGKMVAGPDFSPSVRGEPRDGYGHGTHMAAIIAGQDAEPGGFRGIAPGARIIDIKAAAGNGTTDLHRVVDAIHWVVDHKDDPGLRIRVLNLSFGVRSTADYVVDPLAYAAERAWRAGIVVVAAAGNEGYNVGRKASGLDDPAYDPFVIAVGASDIKGTVARDDDAVAPFSSSAANWNDRRPTLVAPGRAIQSLRVPGSAIARAIPDPTDGNDRFVKGSGTSQAAAMVSGAAALLVSQRPQATPDQIKFLLHSGAVPLNRASVLVQGAGQLDLRKAMHEPTPDQRQTWQPSVGTQLAGGSDSGDANTTGHSWSGHSWSGHSWSGHSWSGHSWSGAEWSAS